MGSTYWHNREIASFSKKGYVFTVTEFREEPSGYTVNNVKYEVTRRAVNTQEIEIVQKDLTSEELVRYLAHCAEDGSIMQEE